MVEKKPQDEPESHLHASNPADSRQIVMHQQVVGLVVEPPLAHDKACSTVLAFLHHVGEVLLFLSAHEGKEYDQDTCGT